MADLSFKAFINTRSNNIKKRDYQFLSEVNVLVLYHEYLTWLLGWAQNQIEKPRFTAGEILLQLKIIHAYHLYLLDIYAKSKSLLKPVELFAVPESLTPHTQANPKFTLPKRNALQDDFDETLLAECKAKHHQAIDISAGNSLALGMANFLILLTVPMAFPWILLVLPLIILFLKTSFDLIAFQELKIPPRFPVPASVVFLSALVGGACNAVALTVNLPVNAIISLSVPGAATMLLVFAFCGTQLAKAVIDYFKPDIARESLAKLRSLEDTEAMAQLKAPLLQEINPNNPSHSTALHQAVTATSHCFISSRLDYQFTHPLAKKDENIEMDIGLLHAEVSRRLPC